VYRLFEFIVVAALACLVISILLEVDMAAEPTTFFDGEPVESSENWISQEVRGVRDE
jgi:hypothetical protein